MRDFSIRPTWNNYIDQMSMVAIAEFSAIYTYVIMVTQSENGSTVHIIPPIVSVIVAIIGLWILLGIVIKRHSWRYSLHEGRITAEQGLISRNETSIRLADVRAVHLKQSILDRMLNVGDVSFSSSAREDAEVTFVGIDEPKKLKIKIENLIHQIKTKKEVE